MKIYLVFLISLLFFNFGRCIESDQLLENKNFEGCEDYNFTIIYDGENVNTNAPDELILTRNSTVCLSLNLIIPINPSNTSNITISSSFFSSIALGSIESSSGVIYRAPYIYSFVMYSNSSVKIDFVPYILNTSSIFLNDIFFFNVTIKDDTNETDTEEGDITYTSFLEGRSKGLNEDLRNERNNSVWNNYTTSSLVMEENKNFEFSHQLSYSPSLLNLPFNKPILLSVLEDNRVEEGLSLSSPSLFSSSIFHSVFDSSLQIYLPFLLSIEFKNSTENKPSSPSLYRNVNIFFIPTKMDQFLVNATSYSQFERGLYQYVKVVQFSESQSYLSSQNITLQNQNIDTSTSSVVFGLILMTIFVSSILLILINIYMVGNN